MNGAPGSCGCHCGVACACSCNSCLRVPLGRQARCQRRLVFSALGVVETLLGNGRPILLLIQRSRPHLEWALRVLEPPNLPHRVASFLADGPLGCAEAPAEALHTHTHTHMYTPTCEQLSTCQRSLTRIKHPHARTQGRTHARTPDRPPAGTLART